MPASGSRQCGCKGVFHHKGCDPFGFDTGQEVLVGLDTPERGRFAREGELAAVQERLDPQCEARQDRLEP